VRTAGRSEAAITIELIPIGNFFSRVHRLHLDISNGAGRSSARVAAAQPYRYSRRSEFERRAMRGRIGLLLATALFAVGADWGAMAAGSGNRTNDRLLAQPENRRIEVLSKSIGHGCVGTSAFPMGVTATGKARGFAYWSLSCKNGKNYVIQIAPNAKGTVAAADCSVLKGTGKECFKKF
jgi:hypothetical protein